MVKLIKPYVALANVLPAFEKIFENGIFTNGEYVQKLTALLQKQTDAKHVFTTTSATTALCICLDILNIGPGDEVAVSDFSFPASVNVIEAVGATPVFVDVDLQTYNMTPDTLRKKLTPKTKAVIFVCALGNPAYLQEISNLCKKEGIVLINDAACAMGSYSQGNAVGGISDLECFSFHPRKLLTCGEGGAVTTSNDTYAQKLRIRLAHGSVPGPLTPDFVDYGFNYRLSELQCAMLIEQFAALPGIVKERNKMASQYAQLLEPKGFRLQTCLLGDLHNRQSVVFTVPKCVDRNDLIISLRQAQVEATIGTYCLSDTTYYKNKYHQTQTNALFLQNNTITLPCHQEVIPSLVVAEISRILHL